MSRAAKYTIGGLIAFGLFAIIIGSPWMIEAPYRLLVGWVHYLIRIVPMVRINVPAVAVFVIAIPVTLVLGHWFLAWLWRGSASVPSRSGFAATVSDCPETLRNLAVILGATEAAAFVEAESGPAELRRIAHIRPGDADAATMRAAIQAFVEISQECLKVNKDGVIHVSNTRDGESQLCLVVLQRYAGKPRIVNCFIVRALDMNAGEQLLKKVRPLIRETTNDVSERPSGAWRWKWSIAGLAMLMLMFVIGTAATGIVHQTGWLITSPKPLVVSVSRPKVLQIKCASNMRQIGLAVRMYQESLPGFRPSNVAELLDAALRGDITTDVFVCPSSDIDGKPPGTQPAEWTAAMVAHPELYLAYTLAPASTLGPDGKRFVLMYESLESHEDGINVLYEEGDVEWLDEPAARAWLKGIGAER